MANGTLSAVIKTGGKQYLVTEGQELLIEKINDTLKAGDKVVFDQVLMTDNGSETTLGKPLVTGTKVEATLVEAGRARKITVIHYKSKVRHRKKMGHRQPFMKVKIDKIA